jgi:hypothetical protein
MTLLTYIKTVGIDQIIQSMLFIVEYLMIRNISEKMFYVVEKICECVCIFIGEMTLESFVNFIVLLFLFTTIAFIEFVMVYIIFVTVYDTIMYSIKSYLHEYNKTHYTNYVIINHHMFDNYALQKQIIDYQNMLRNKVNTTIYGLTQLMINANHVNDDDVEKYEKIFNNVINKTCNNIFYREYDITTYMPLRSINLEKDLIYLLKNIVKCANKRLKKQNKKNGCEKISSIYFKYDATNKECEFFLMSYELSDHMKL